VKQYVQSVLIPKVSEIKTRAEKLIFVQDNFSRNVEVYNELVSIVDSILQFREYSKYNSFRFFKYKQRIELAISKGQFIINKGKHIPSNRSELILGRTRQNFNDYLNNFRRDISNIVVVPQEITV
tara:strand:+ start:1462 stop:1836 length:375 start_codon:yes stop_codon:yes gene_type:complete